VRILNIYPDTFKEEVGIVSIVVICVRMQGENLYLSNINYGIWLGRGVIVKGKFLKNKKVYASLMI
jgi:hypothetical protein